MHFASFSSGKFEAWNKKDRPTTLKRLWKSFIIIWTTWYNLRKRAVEYAYKLTAIHVKNTFFVNVSLLSWNKMVSILGRIGCQSFYRIDRIAIVRCCFIFLGIDWYRFFYCYLHFDCYLHFCTPHHSNVSTCASAVDTKIVFNKTLMSDE